MFSTLGSPLIDLIDLHLHVYECTAVIDRCNYACNICAVMDLG